MQYIQTATTKEPFTEIEAAGVGIAIAGGIIAFVGIAGLVSAPLLGGSAQAIWSLKAILLGEATLTLPFMVLMAKAALTR